MEFLIFSYSLSPGFSFFLGLYAAGFRSFTGIVFNVAVFTFSSPFPFHPLVECPTAAVTAEAPGPASPISFDRLPTLRTEPLRTGLEEQGKILLSFDVFHAYLLSAKIPKALETKDFRA